MFRAIFSYMTVLLRARLTSLLTSQNGPQVPGTPRCCSFTGTWVQEAASKHLLERPLEDVAQPGP